MASNGYLRTVRMGGFDKSDVLAYVDDLNSKIYNLESQVADQQETIERLEKKPAAVLRVISRARRNLRKRLKRLRIKLPS